MSNLSNVALWFSKNEEGETVTINKVTEENKGKYKCPLCGSEVIPKAVDSKHMSAHFAHIDKSKCCGETIVHWWLKNELIKVGDEFTIITDKENRFTCKSLEVEKEYSTSNGIYKPDITLETQCGNIVFVEINVSNKKKPCQYLDMWKELNNIVIEFNVKDFINEEGEITMSDNFKAMYYNGKPFIDKDCPEYQKYISSLSSGIRETDIESLKKMEWFIDDMYRYGKGEIDVSDIEIGYEEAVEISKGIVESLYRNKKCSNAIRDILEYRDRIMDGIKAKILEEFKVDVSCSQNSKERLISKRLFNPNFIKINIESMLKKEVDSRNMSSKINYLHEIGVPYFYDGCNIGVSGFSNITPYENTRKNVLELKDKFMCDLELLEKIYDVIYKENYLYFGKSENPWGYNIKSKIKEFVLEQLKDLLMESGECARNWKYINKSTTEIIDYILESEHDYFRDYTQDIYGKPFVNMDSVELKNDIKKIGDSFLKIKEEYDFILERCEIVEKILKACGYESFSINANWKPNISYSIEVDRSRLGVSIFDDGVIKMNGFNICRTDLSNIDTFIKDFEVSINYTTNQGNCLFSRGIIDLYSKILDRYTKETNKFYKVRLDRMNFVILNNYNQEISSFRYDENTTFDEVVTKFSEDIRNYLYSKEII